MPVKPLLIRLELEPTTSSRHSADTTMTAGACALAAEIIAARGPHGAFRLAGMILALAVASSSPAVPRLTSGLSAARSAVPASTRGAGEYGDGRRIVGGSDASSTEVPIYYWTTLIDKLGGSWTLCTGELISPTWMLTAGHCILNFNNDGYRSAGPGSTRIVYGCHNLKDTSSCKVMGAKRYVAHPCYTPSTDQDHDDIALIELENPVQGMEGKFALVDGLNGSLPSIEAGKVVYLAGFGATRGNGAVVASTLQEVEVTAVSTADCEKQNPYSRDKKYINFEHIICTGGTAGKDSCNGDSGGPAIVVEDGQPWLVGILSKGSQLPSFSADCAVEGRYGMYTRVHLYAGWIEAVLNGWDFPCEGYEYETPTCQCLRPAKRHVTEESFDVYVAVKLPYSRNEFDESKRQEFREAMASLAGVSDDSVVIVSVVEQARRAQMIKVNTRIIGSSSAGRDAIFLALGSGDADVFQRKLDVVLTEKGLRESVGVTAPSTQAPPASSSEAEDTSAAVVKRGLSLTVVVIISVFGGIILICGAVVLFQLCFNRCRRPPFPSACQPFPGRETPFVP